jgi:hypothetical protein
MTGTRTAAGSRKELMPLVRLMRIRSRGVLRILAGAAVVLLGACAPRPGLYPLPDFGLTAMPVGDDLDFEGLAPAVLQSIGYFRRAGDAASFSYGDAREMEASARLFLDIVEGFEGAARDRAIREKFLFFESRNKKGGAFFTGYYEPILAGGRERSPLPAAGRGAGSLRPLSTGSRRIF